MRRRIYLDPKIGKHLDRLRRSGKKAATAANRVEEIITRLEAGTSIPAQVGSVTKHGELRIKGVLKYDLGGGYRLITFKQGNGIFLLYAGTHDDCHRWIENNRELTVGQIHERCTHLRICSTAACSDPNADSTEIEEEPLDPLESVDEQLLRQAFCGLVEGRRS